MPNKYPTICTRCKIALPAGDGRLFQQYTRRRLREPLFLARCLDETGCDARVKAIAAAETAAAQDIRRAKPEYARRIALAEKYPNLPKTVAYTIDGVTVTLTRRVTPKRVIVTTKVTGRDYVTKDAYLDEAEAIGHTADLLHKAAFPPFKPLAASPDAAAVLEAAAA